MNLDNVIKNKEEIDTPLVINLAQEKIYQDNHLIGTLREDGDSDNPKTKQGESGVFHVFEWYPSDAVDTEKADRYQRTPVADYDEINNSSICPRTVYILYPDNWSDLPKPVKDINLGLVLENLHYKKKRQIKALEKLEDMEDEIFEKIEYAVANTELDDAVSEKAKDAVNNLLHLKKSMDGRRNDD